jgi:hypothetical protein
VQTDRRRAWMSMNELNGTGLDTRCKLLSNDKNV